MKIKEKIPVPASTQEIVKEVICDLCGNKTEGDGWEETHWQINETTVSCQVSAKTGETWPSGGWCTSVVIDICPECFHHKLVPWLESQGVKIQPQQSDW